MPLTLWTEHETGYRSPAFFARIAKSLGNMAVSCCYIVPDAAQKRSAEGLCLRHGPDIFFANQVLTFQTWAASLVPIPLPVISTAERVRRLAALLPTLDLHYFQRGAAQNHPGDILARGITATWNGNLSPQELTELARDYGQEREQDLASVFAAYSRLLDQTGHVDPSQIPLVARNAIHGGRSLPHQRIIIEVGISPAPVLWSVLAALARHPQAVDLHVITPEMHRHLASFLLGESAQEIHPDEWIPTSPAICQLFRAPNATAAFHFLAESLHPEREMALLPCDPDPLPWLLHAQATRVIPADALSLRLAASPLSAPWHDPREWQDTPGTATVGEWAAWWKPRLTHPTAFRAFSSRIHDDPFACRALRDMARWDEVWRRLTAVVGDSVPLSAAALRTLVHPMIQGQPAVDPDTLPYLPITLDYVLGHRLGDLFFLDATQDLLPKLSPSPFFRRAALLPQDPNTRRLRGAFPGTEDLLATAMAATARLLGTTENATAIYSATHDNLGEQFPSLLFEAAPIDIPMDIPVVTNTSPLPPENSGMLLHDTDTRKDVQRRMRDHIFSITEIEDFATCPFRHFARYILGIDVPIEDTPELPARSEGQIIHRLLERYYAAPRDAASSGGVHDILAGILAHDIQTDRPLRQIQIDRLLLTATAAVDWDNSQRERLGADALTPALTEWKFGYDPVPALTLQGPDGPIRIRGKVDRIDIHAAQKRFLLIDYKYKQSEVKPILGDIRNGLHLQIPLYILAAEAAFPDHQLLGGLLFDLNACQRHYGMARKSEAEFLGIPGKLQSLTQDATWDELLQTASDHAITYARAIQTAQLPRPPHDCRTCDWKGLLPWDE